MTDTTVIIQAPAPPTVIVNPYGLSAAAVTAMIAAQAVMDSTTYVTYDGTNLRKAGTVIPITGGGSSVTFVDNGDGTGTITFTSGGTTAGLVGSAAVGSSTIAA